MKQLSEEAKKHLEQYLDEVRTCLEGCASVDSEEIQQDVTEHIERELENVEEPVSFNEVDDILRRLGPPRQWVPQEEEVSWWRKVILRLRKGPEDWRLAYLSFGLFLIWLLALGGFRYALFAPLVILRARVSGIILLASFILARAAISTVKDTKQLGGQKWLLYPSLLVVYIPLLIIFIWPVIPVVILGEQSYGHTFPFSQKLGIAPGSLNESFFWILAGVGVLALWWTILGVICCSAPNLIKTIFRPFADWFNRKWATLLIIVGLLITAISLAPLVLGLFGRRIYF
jgi:hypothetical protein